MCVCVIVCVRVYAPDQNSISLGPGACHVV